MGELGCVVGTLFLLSTTMDTPDRKCMITRSSALPVAYTPETVVVQPRSTLVIKARVPSHLRDGQTVWLDPLPHERFVDTGTYASYQN
jgi:hypothetical protein